MIDAMLLETLRDLPRHEKLRVIEFLAADLAENEPEVRTRYPVLTPYGATNAATTLQEFLRHHGSTDS